MPNKNGVIAVGVELDYQKTLNKMVGDFKSEMSQIQQTLGKAHLSKDLERQIANLTERIEEVATTASKSFDNLGKGKISTETFDKFQNEVNGKFQNIKREISILTGNLDDLSQKFGLLEGSEFSSKIVNQFKEIQDTVLNTNTAISNFYKVASQNGMELNLVDSGENVAKLRQEYSELSQILEFIQKQENASYNNKSNDKLISELEHLKKEWESLDDVLQNTDLGGDKLEKTEIKYKLITERINSIITILNRNKIDFSSIFDQFDVEILGDVDTDLTKVEKTIVSKLAEIESKIKDRGEKLVTPEMFVIKDGTIKVPIDIATNSRTLNNKLNEIIESMQANAIDKTITVPITLVSKDNIKTAKDAKAEIDKTLSDNDTIINMGKTYEVSLKKALKSATLLTYEAIRSIKEALVQHPVVIHPKFEIYKKDLVAFQKAVNQYSKELNIDLSTQVQDLSKELNKLYSTKNITTWSNSMEKHLDKVLGKIKEISDFIKGTDGSSNTLNTFFDNIDTQKLEGLLGIVGEISKALVFLKQDLKLENIDNFQKDIIELKDSLKEISSALSSDQKLTLGIDEQSINRITTSIEHMSNMLSRAFGVATDADISSQWNLVDQKFKSIADKSGKINLNKSKKDIQELIALYQEYVSMGGTNQLGALTDNVQTVEKLNKKWEQVNATVSEITDKEKTQTLLPELEADVKLTPNADGFKSEADKLLENINLEKEVKLSVGNIATTNDTTSSIADDKPNVANNTTSKKEQVINLLKQEKLLREDVVQLVQDYSSLSKRQKTSVGNKLGDNKNLADLLRIIELAQGEAAKLDLILDDIYGKTSSNQTPVSSDDTSIKKVEQELKDVEVQAEKTAHAVKIISLPTSDDKIVDTSLLNKLKEIRDIEIEVDKLLSSEGELTDKSENLMGVAAEKTFAIANAYEVAWQRINIQAQTTDEELKSLASQISSKSIVPDTSGVIEFNNNVNKLKEILKEVYGSGVNFEELYLDIFNKLRDGAISLNEAIEDIVDNEEWKLDRKRVDSGYTIQPLEYYKKVFISDKEYIEIIRKNNEELAEEEKKRSEVMSELEANAKKRRKFKLLSTPTIQSQEQFDESTLSSTPIDTSKSVVELNDLLEKINKVESAVSELSNVSISLDVKLPKKIDDTTIEAFGKLKAIFDGNNIWINELKTLSDAFANLKVSKTLSTNLVDVAIGLEEFSKQINSIDIGGSTFLKDINELLSKGDELKNLASVLKASQKQIKEATKNVSGSTTSKSDTSKIEKQQRKLQELRDKFDTKLSLKDDVANADDFIERLNKIEVILNKYPDGSNVDFLSEETKKDFEEISKLFKELDGKEFKLGNQTKAKKTILDINTYLKENTKITAEAKAQLKKLLTQLDGFSGTPQDLQRITQEFLEIKNSMVVAGKEGKSFFTGIRGQIKHMWEKGIAQWFSLYDIIRYGRQVVETIKEIDTAITELRKVSDTTEQRLSQNFRNSAETAKDLGSSISDVINATSDWSRMGYSVDEAEELAKISTLYKNVGDGIDIDTANESLISTLRGFKMEAEDAIEIVDKFNQVANTEAIDSAGIGEALQRSAASFNASNTSLSEAIALITTANSVIQDPSVVGNMWKTTTMRIRGAKAELEEAGEDTEGMVESTSKLRDMIKGMTGFDIMEDENTFKSTYEIIKGIGYEWKNLSDIDQAALLEALAGKRAGNALSAVLNDMETLERSYQTAEESAGSAMREQENYEKSIQYSLDRLTASAQEWSASLVDSGIIKWFVDAANAVVEFSTAITPLGNIGIAGGIFAAFKAFKGDGKCGFKNRPHFKLNMPSVV